MELALQGYSRRVKTHRIKGSPRGRPYGKVAADAFSVFPVSQHSLSINGDFDGHISIDEVDLRKILADAGRSAGLANTLESVTDCLEILLRRAEEEEDLDVSSAETAALLHATTLLSMLASRVSKRAKAKAEKEKRASRGKI